MHAVPVQRQLTRTRSHLPECNGCDSLILEGHVSWVRYVRETTSETSHAFQKVFREGWGESTTSFRN